MGMVHGYSCECKVFKLNQVKVIGPFKFKIISKYVQKNRLEATTGSESLNQVEELRY